MQVVSGVQKFYNRCIAMNIATTTINTYRYRIERFIKMTGVQDLDEVTSETMYSLFARMRKEGFSASAIRGEYVTLNTMFTFLVQEEYLDINPLRNIKRPKLPKVYARTFTPQEVSKIVKFYAGRADEIGLRNYAIISLLFGTGIRRAELINLSIMDVNLDEAVLTVFGKGNKQRLIPLTGVLKKILKRYIKIRSDSYCQNFFITRDGNKLSIDCIREIFKEIKKDLNMSGKRFSPHTMRHTFAKMFLLNGGDLFALQKILGHEDISTTRMYVDYTEKEMSVQMQQCSPLENHRWTYF